MCLRKLKLYFYLNYILTVLLLYKINQYSVVVTEVGNVSKPKVSRAENQKIQTFSFL